MFASEAALADTDVSKFSPAVLRAIIPPDKTNVYPKKYIQMERKAVSANARPRKTIGSAARDEANG